VCTLHYAFSPPLFCFRTPYPPRYPPMHKCTKLPKINKKTADRGIFMSYKDARDERRSYSLESLYWYGFCILTVAVTTFVLLVSDVLVVSVASALVITYLLGGLSILAMLRSPRGKRLRWTTIIIVSLGCLLILGSLSLELIMKLAGA
jgi:hypothetical protein